MVFYNYNQKEGIFERYEDISIDFEKNQTVTNVIVSDLNYDGVIDLAVSLRKNDQDKHSFYFGVENNNKLAEFQLFTHYNIESNYGIFLSDFNGHNKKAIMFFKDKERKYVEFEKKATGAITVNE